jgi:DNA-binding PadR family transcriptional regulator
MSPVFRHGRLRLYLLRLLDEEPRHGYEVIRMLRDQFMGVYAPSPGTIYPRLARLEEEGLVTHDELDGRKVYRITDAGRQELHEREDELAELEQELSDSVRDVVREVKEDVRETVRNLREELTWAARTARQPDETGSERPGGPGDQLRAQGEDVRQRARWSREEAKEQARRVRDGARENARRAREDAKEWARQEREQARSSARDWEWASWAGWSDSPGRRGRPGRPDAAPLRDLEQTVKGFVRDLGRLAWQSGATAGEDALTELRIILDETLERVRSEIFAASGPHGDPLEETGPELETVKVEEPGGQAASPGAGSPGTGPAGPTDPQPEPGRGAGALSPAPDLRRIRIPSPIRSVRAGCLAHPPRPLTAWRAAVTAEPFPAPPYPAAAPRLTGCILRVIR